MSSGNRTWDSEELTLKNELKLIDDSYYRVYDDNDYEIWKERMMSVIENQFKMTSLESSFQAENGLNLEGGDEAAIDPVLSIESSLNEINPIKPAVLELPDEVIYQGINDQPVNLENYNANVSSWGLKFLLREIDRKCHNESLKTQCKSMLLDNKPGKSKWSNSSRLGQAELYNGLEKVLLDLKSYTPYSIPFLVKVSKKDVPDYYNVIKKPMDLGSIGKKLKNQEYNSKQQFVDDLNLIYANCYTYNTAEDSIYRQHIQMLRDKWTYLLKSIPEIVVGKYVPSMVNESAPSSVASTLTISKTKGPSSDDSSTLKASSTVLTKKKGSGSKGQVPEPKPIIVKSSLDMDGFDDLDDLLNTHLESLSDIDSCPSPKKQKKSEIIDPQPRFSHFVSCQNTFPGRNERLMVKYSIDFKASRSGGKINSSNASSEENQQNIVVGSFIFPELVYFYNTVPDTHLRIQGESIEPSSIKASCYSASKAMNQIYENFRILQSIRDIRKHLLESSRLEPPNLDHLNTPTSRFDDFEVKTIHTPWQARVILKKIISLYLSQAGFELISSSALHAFYEMFDVNFIKIFETLKAFNAQYSGYHESADIVRLALLQLNVKHLSDLEVVQSEPSYAKARLNHLLDAMKLRLQDSQSIRNYQTQKESSDHEDDNEDDEAENEDEEDETTINETQNDPEEGDNEDEELENDNEELEEDDDEASNEEEEENDTENEED